ncbi:hypothetical protein N9B63_06125 [Akkermansiaceae bacterium]|nr:hypothetical protein [Akkermansiaceae bacterium]MDA7868754.1 hypothetical protein [bacterium]MDA7930400.1 hypothetical protein [Akkermansiaceae bacterium]MDA8976840.1 hypothetical protein [bacterium]
MKPTLRDYLTILFALLVIFFCGSGVGFLIGEKKGHLEAEKPRTIKSGHDHEAWETQTMERLEKLLSLDPSQRDKVLGEVKTTSAEIGKGREDALADHYRAILGLHDRMLPHLKPDQQKKIERDRKSLQRAIDLRFKSKNDQ